MGIVDTQQGTFTLGEEAIEETVGLMGQQSMQGVNPGIPCWLGGFKPTVPAGIKSWLLVRTVYTCFRRIYVYEVVLKLSPYE